ncbi:MAG: hypothetical protein RLZZ210_783 [Pseudomonadota bacterium]|jgi:uncharacterized protein (DUF4415 family)
MNRKSKTDWAKLKQIAESNAPIPYDDEDRVNGLYDPNNDEEVEAFFANAKVIRSGRPKQELTKKATSLRLDEDIIKAFKATGKGWQTRINDALVEWLKEHKLP